MSLYVDASAILKRYLEEPEADAAEEILHSDPDQLTARHSYVEVRRVLAQRLTRARRSDARKLFEREWRRFAVVDPTEGVCEAAAALAESTGIRTLDALHLGAAEQAGAGKIPFVTYDIRQARVARSLGWTVLGV